MYVCSFSICNALGDFETFLSNYLFDDEMLLLSTCIVCIKNGAIYEIYGCRLHLNFIINYIHTCSRCDHADAYATTYKCSFDDANGILMKFWEVMKSFLIFF